MTLDELVGSPRRMTIAGRAVMVRPLSLKEWGNLQAWLKDNGESPLRRCSSADLAKLDDRDRAVVLKEVYLDQRRWPPQVASRDWFNAMSSAVGGDAQFLHAVLSREHPELTLDECDRISHDASPEESAMLVALAIGIEPPPKSTAPEPSTEAGAKAKAKTTRRRSPASTTGARTSTPSRSAK